MREKIVKIKFSEMDNGVFRFRGFSGLGNLLCTWGEAMLLAKQNNAKIIWPTWPQLSLSALRYKRTYFKVFRNNGKYISARDYFFLKTKKKISKSDIIYSGPKIPYNVNWVHSENSLKDALWLRDNLLDIVAPRFIKRIEKIQTPPMFIGLHIRRGDFLNPIQHFKDGSGRDVNKAIELSWFVQAIATVRSVLGDLPVICISDADADELKPILRLEDVQIQSEHPIVDLLTMTKASGFIASGSTFSQWISYLGGMDTWINMHHTWYSPDHLSPKLHVI